MRRILRPACDKVGAKRVEGTVFGQLTSPRGMGGISRWGGEEGGRGRKEKAVHTRVHVRRIDTFLTRDTIPRRCPSPRAV